jgi:K+-sensing histidine kinase KdpD
MEKMSVLVCVTGQKTCEKLISEGARQAEDLGAELTVVHVARQGAGLLGGNIAEAEALEYLFEKSTAYGAGMTVIRSNDVVPTIAAHAQKVNAILTVLGSTRSPGRDVTKNLRSHMPDMEFKIVYTEE